MAAGGILAGHRVGRTMARRIAAIETGSGAAGNLATSLLVIVASALGLPVSTTHVSTGAIAGIGAASDSLRQSVLRRIVGSWVLTLPVAALGAIVSYRAMV